MCNINNHLIDLINDMGLEIHFVEMNRTGIYFAKEHVIFLSNKLIDKNSDFEIAHELGHCIKRHEELSSFYCSSSTNRHKMELEANRIAIEILLHIWINNCDYEKENLNAIKFMEFYNIPGFLESYVKESMLKAVH